MPVVKRPAGLHGQRPAGKVLKRPASTKRPAASTKRPAEVVAEFDWRSAPDHEVELQMNPLAAIANQMGLTLSEFFNTIFMTFTIASANFIKDHPFAPGEESIPYGDSPREVIALHRPATPSGATVMFIHGGYFKATSKKEHYWCAKDFLSRGATVVNAEYALCPTVRLKVLVSQVIRCFHFVLNHLTGWGLDPTRFYLAGHSAGAHLVAALLSDPQRAQHVAAAHLMSGIYETPVIRRLSFKDDIGLDDEEAESTNMLLHPPAKPVPVCISYGGNEPLGWRQQSLAYAELARGAGCSTSVLEVPGSHHFELLQSGVSEGGEGFEGFVRHVQGAVRDGELSPSA